MIDSGSPQPIDTTKGVDTDHDGLGDTLPLDELDVPAMAVDLDRDGVADVVIHIDVDGVSHCDALPPQHLGELAHGSDSMLDHGIPYDCFPPDCLPNEDLGILGSWSFHPWLW